MQSHWSAHPVQHVHIKCTVGWCGVDWFHIFKIWSSCINLSTIQWFGIQQWFKCQHSMIFNRKLSSDPYADWKAHSWTGIRIYGSPSDIRLRFNIPSFDLGASLPQEYYMEGKGKQAWCNYGRTHFSLLPVTENKLQIGWWHDINDIKNVSSDGVTTPLIYSEKATHTHTFSVSATNPIYSWHF